MSHDSMKAQLGKQFLSLEEGSVLVVRLAGELTEQEMVDCMATVEGWTDGYRCLLMLVDLTNLSAFSSGARRAASQKPIPPGQRQAFACIGASFRTRVVMGLVIKAMQLLKSIPLDIAFFPHEAEARAWLAQLRDRYALIGDDATGVCPEAPCGEATAARDRGRGSAATRA